MSDAGRPDSGPPQSVGELEERLSRPRAATVDALGAAPGDLVVLGAGGKMGPTLARMARRAATAADGADDRRRVVAVSRFGDPAVRRGLDDAGVHTIACDLLDADAVAALPDAPTVVFMAGQKFGTAAAPSLTWAMNTMVPAWCAMRYRHSRVVAFSTGNVYGLTPAAGPGSSEGDAPDPVGEYAASCVGRERIFEHAASRHGAPLALLRLNYAVDLRYGVLVDLALRVRDGLPIDLAMGHVNVIWQGDANRIALESLSRAAVPPYVLNVTGRERIGVRDAALRLGARLGREPLFTGTEAPDALLADTTKLARDFAPPEVDTPQLIRWVADWVGAGRPLLGKPTGFERRDGRF